MLHIYIYIYINGSLVCDHKLYMSGSAIRSLLVINEGYDILSQFAAGCGGHGCFPPVDGGKKTRSKEE